jgi:hypothetical protein
MSRKNKEVVVKKGDVTAVATEITLKGLLKHGWEVVGDSDKDHQAELKKQADEEEKLDKTVEKYFPSDDEEN